MKTLTPRAALLLTFIVAVANISFNPANPAREFTLQSLSLSSKAAAEDLCKAKKVDKNNPTQCVMLYDDFWVIYEIKKENDNYQIKAYPEFATEGQVCSNCATLTRNTEAKNATALHEIAQKLAEEVHQTVLKTKKKKALEAKLRKQKQKLIEKLEKEKLLCKIKDYELELNESTQKYMPKRFKYKHKKERLECQVNALSELDEDSKDYKKLLKTVHDALPQYLLGDEDDQEFGLELVDSLKDLDLGKRANRALDRLVQYTQTINETADKLAEMEPNDPQRIYIQGQLTQLMGRIGWDFGGTSWGVKLSKAIYQASRNPNDPFGQSEITTGSTPGNQDFLNPSSGKTTPNLGSQRPLARGGGRVYHNPSFQYLGNNQFRPTQPGLTNPQGAQTGRLYNRGLYGRNMRNQTFQTNPSLRNSNFGRQNFNLQRQGTGIYASQANPNNSSFLPTSPYYTPSSIYNGQGYSNTATQVPNRSFNSQRRNTSPRLALQPRRR